MPRQEVQSFVISNSKREVGQQTPQITEIEIFNLIIENIKTNYPEIQDIRI